MANEKNFLLGRGQLLTTHADPIRNSGAKTPPYDLDSALSRMSSFLLNAAQHFDSLPPDACPDDKVVAFLTMHPRYISKTDYPRDLLAKAGLTTVGGKSAYVRPEAWGVDKHPDGAIADTLFVSATRSSIHRWVQELPQWDKTESATTQLQTIENISAPQSISKIKRQDGETGSHVYEAVLHSDGSPLIIDAFYDFVGARNAQPIKERVRFAGGIVFVPIETELENADVLADFSFLRALRPMPKLRTFRPPVLRSDFVQIPNLPSEGVALSDTRIAIFDGGLPENSPVHPWVNSLEPANIGPPNPGAVEHGEQVTSAFLFGHMTPGAEIDPPYGIVDHVRVIDQHTGMNADYELYDVLDRILATLDLAENPYEYINLSLGPNLPVEDDEITAWTAELDQRAANGLVLITSAAGNSGERDATNNFNRIQPPSDGVNLLAVGACDSLDSNWSRCPYSSVGPGRTPGVAKPDGVAFGGVFERPFGVINTTAGGGLNGTMGTSFAAPFTLRTAVGIQSLAGDELSPLSVRALLVHSATQNGHPPGEVGWGRFGVDPLALMTCDRDEVTVVYQGHLPLKKFLRAPIALPDTPLKGMVSITATLVVASDVDPAFSHAYTRAGLEVVFRPNEKRRKQDRVYANSESFFSANNLYKAPEHQLRGDGHKWEPCWKATRQKRGSSLSKPCFDIYYHNRHEGRADMEPHPLPYALVVTVKAPKVGDLYEKTLSAYSDVLVPIEPVVPLPVSL